MRSSGFAQAPGIPALSAWTALRDALSFLGVRRFALGTPYPRAIHALARPFFKHRGYEVHADATLDIVAMRDVPAVGAERLSAFIAALDTQTCDAIVLLATDLPTFGCLAELEAIPAADFRHPTKRCCGARFGCSKQRPAKPLGRLFERLSDLSRMG